MSRPRPDPRRRRIAGESADYRAGYRAGQIFGTGYNEGRTAGGGGRRPGCWPWLLLAAAAVVVLAIVAECAS